MSKQESSGGTPKDDLLKQNLQYATETTSRFFSGFGAFLSSTAKSFDAELQKKVKEDPNSSAGKIASGLLTTSATTSEYAKKCGSAVSDKTAELYHKVTDSYEQKAKLLIEDLKQQISIIENERASKIKSTETLENQLANTSFLKTSFIVVALLRECINLLENKSELSDIIRKREENRDMLIKFSWGPEQLQTQLKQNMPLFLQQQVERLPTLDKVFKPLNACDWVNHVISLKEKILEEQVNSTLQPKR